MNLDLSRDEAKDRVGTQILEEEERGAMVIFTDGSLMGEGGGAAAVSKFESRSLSCSPDGITNNELELLAIGLGVAQYSGNRSTIESQNQYQALAIFSDSQIALKATHEPLTPKAMQYLARSVKTFISNLGNVLVRLYWTPGHEDIELNEKADETAKAAAEDTNQSQLTPTSLSKLLQVTRETFHLQTEKFETGRQNLRTQPRRVADVLAQLEKGEAAVIFHLRSGHSPLNKYLKRFNHHATGKCDHCKIPKSVAHFILHCPNYKQQRKRFRDAVKEEELKVNPYLLPALLNTTKVFPLQAKFVLETGRFKFLKKYTKTKSGDSHKSTKQ